MTSDQRPLRRASRSPGLGRRPGERSRHHNGTSAAASGHGVPPERPSTGRERSTHLGSGSRQDWSSNHLDDDPQLVSDRT
ncbi:hypothetical protein MTO96_001487 [Rhipicephalus appendiculatus]